MKKYEGFEAKASVGGSDPLPAGGYIARIIDVKEKPWASGAGTSVVFLFDILEGEYANYFKSQFDANHNEDKKWKGVLRVTAPDENSQWYESQTETMNQTIGNIQESNDGFTFDWGKAWAGDWSQLKGKTVGVLFRNKEWEYDGKAGWTTEAAYFRTTDYIHGGNFKIPKDKPLKNKPVESSTYASYAPAVDDSELPF